MVVDDDLGSLRLDALHDALDGALAEVIAVRLHRQAIDTDGAGMLPRLIVNIVIGIAVDTESYVTGSGYGNF